MLIFLKTLFSKKNTNSVADWIANGAVLLNVRSPTQLAEATVKGTLHKRLHALSRHVQKFSNHKTIRMFC